MTFQSAAQWLVLWVGLVAAAPVLPTARDNAVKTIGLNLHNNMPTEAALAKMQAAGVHTVRVMVSHGKQWKSRQASSTSARPTTR